MSIVAGSETTSVQATDRSSHQEFLAAACTTTPKSVTGKRRRIIVSLALLVSDLISALLVILLVDGAYGFRWTETAPTALPVLIGIFSMSGLYSSYLSAPGERVRARFLGTLAFVATLIVLSWETFDPTVWLLATGGAVFLFLLGYYAEAMTRHALIRLQLWGAATAFAGRGSAIEQAKQLLSAIPELGLRPVDRSGPGDDPPSLDYAEIEYVVAATEADLVRVSMATRFAISPPRVLLLQNAKPSKNFLAPGAISFSIGSNINTPLNRAMKRAIDLIVGIPALLVALPLIAVLALLIKVFNPGPAFYAQVRVGFKNCSFRILKLRTMHCDAERLLEHYLHNNEAARLEWKCFFKLSQDPRVLPYIGNIIRRMSLDELPQLWQVVGGELSLIGPRPFPTYHTDLFDPAFQALRSSVPAGLTGFWQVSARSNGDIEAQKAQDLYYIRNWSIWLDLYILLQTIPAVIGARGDR